LGGCPFTRRLRRHRISTNSGTRPWAGWGHAVDSAADQRPEDASWLCFDSDPWAEAIDIFGNPALRLRLSADRPQANVIARLCDVAPDGRSTLITRGP
jgi:predicted acyl esterase